MHRPQVITIPENVTAIKPDTFYWCFSLKDITLPAGLTSFQDNLSFCPAGRIRATDIKTDENGTPILNPDGSYIYIYTPDGAIYYKNYKPPQMPCLQTMITMITLVPMIN